jgi:hypothetical protein
MSLERDVLGLQEWRRQTETFPAGGITQIPVSAVGQMHSAAVVTAFATNWQSLAFPDAASTFAYYTFFLPAGWGGRTLTIKALWAPTNTNTGNAAFNFVTKELISGTTTTSSPFSNVNVASAGTGTIDQPTTVSTTVALTGLVSGDALQVRVGRAGADGGDTFTGSALFIALLLSV